MCSSKAVSVVSFVGALVIGLATAGWFVTVPSGPVPVDVWQTVPPVNDADDAVPVRAEDLIGRWEGGWNYWGDTGGTCTIDIERVRGNYFYGTLTQNGAEVTFEGTFDPSSRRIFFRETKVIKIGVYSEWLLGTYFGSLSDDGRTLIGAGKDSSGGYDWNVIKMRGEKREN
jgi:hypothetical protein